MAHLDIVRTLPSAFRCINLEPASELALPGWGVGYLLVAPLDVDGRLDPDLAADYGGACRVLRLRVGGEPEEGSLRRDAEGWIFEADDAEEGAFDEPGFRLGEHRFVAGAHVTFQEDNGACIYRVVSVKPL